MRLLDVPPGATVWADERGELRCWSPSPGIFVLKLGGYCEQELARKFAADFDRTWPGQLKAIFFDAGDMNGYESKFRLLMQDWARGVKKRTGTLHVWTQSKLVQMGVAVANL